MSRIIDIVASKDLAAEPVSRSEVKAYLHIDFNDADSLLDIMIGAARRRLEAFTGRCFGSKELSVYMYVDGPVEIPYGPTSEVVSVSLSNGSGYDSYSDYTLEGEDFLTFTPQRKGVYKLIVKSTGTVPDDLKLALIAEVAYRYENRSDVNAATMSTQAKELAMPYRRISTTL